MDGWSREKTAVHASDVTSSFLLLWLYRVCHIPVLWWSSEPNWTSASCGWLPSPAFHQCCVLLCSPACPPSWRTRRRPSAEHGTASLSNSAAFKVCCLCLAAGSEFLLPVRGFFCLLCKVFSGDAICAEEHVTTHAHNHKYKVGVQLGASAAARNLLNPPASLDAS